VVLHGWTQVAGRSELALRFPSVLFGTAAVGALYLLADAVFDRYTAVLASLLMAVSPVYIRYSQEARMYALAVFLTVLATYFLYRSVDSMRSRHLAAYVTSAVLLGYTHVWGLFVLGAHAVYVAVVLWKRWNDHQSAPWRSWIVSYLAIGLLLSPWLGVLLWRAFLPHGNSVIAAFSEPSMVDLLLTPVQWITGDRLIIGSRTRVSLALVVSITVFTVGFWIFQTVVNSDDARPRTVFAGLPVYKGSFRHVTSLSGVRGILFGLLLIGPLALGVSLSYAVRPIYDVRFTIIPAIGFYVLLARGVSLTRRFTAGHLVAVLLVAGLLLPLPGYYARDSKEPWSQVTDRIDRHADEDDLVLITDEYTQVAYAYYAEDSPATVRTVAENSAKEVGLHPIYQSAPSGHVGELATGHDTVWLVLSHTAPAHNDALLEQLNSTHELREREGTPWALELLRFSPTNATQAG